MIKNLLQPDFLFTDDVIQQETFARDVLVGLGRDLQLPQSVALTQFRMYIDDVYQLWSDGFSIEPATRFLCELVKAGAKNDPDLSWYIKDDDSAVFSISDYLNAKQQAPLPPVKTEAKKKKHTPKAPVQKPVQKIETFGDWNICMNTKQANHPSGLTLHFEGDPNSDDFSVKPVSTTSSSSAPEAASLLREGVTLYTKAFNVKAKSQPIDLSDESLHQGVVKWFSDKKGFGFIRSNDMPDDIFVHHKSIVGKGFKKLFVGQDVSFKLAQGDRGLQANEVNILSRSS